MAEEIDRLLFAEIAQRRRAPGEDICSLLVAARFEDGTAWTTRDPRPADDAADRRPRDDRDRAGVVARPARAPPGRDGPRADRRRRVPARGRLRVAAAAPGRAAGRPPPRRRPERQRPHAPGRDRRHAVDLARAHAPAGVSGAVRVPARALPRPPAVDLHLDPVRRRRAPLHRRGVRGAGDARRAGARSWPASTCAPPAGAPSASRAATSRSRRATARGSSSRRRR